MRKLGILIGAALALAACSTAPRVPPVVDLNNPLLAPGFLAQAASGDQFEIQSSQLALQSSQNIGVRNFAIIRERVRDVLSVDDDTLLDALKFTMYRTKLVIEPTGALGIAERIRVSLSQAPVDTPERAIPVTMSLGVTASSAEGGLDPDGLLRAADRALYRAKTEGRNRVVVDVAAPARPASREAEHLAV